MLFLTRTDKPDLEKLIDYSHEEPYVKMDYYAFQSEVYYDTNLVYTLENWLKNHMAFKTRFMHTSLKSADIAMYLRDYEYVPEFNLVNRKSGNWTLDAKKVLQPLHEKGYAKEFLEIYLEYTSLKSKTNSMNKVLDRRNTIVGKNNDGYPYVEIPFHYEPTENERLYTKEENVQGFSKSYLNNMTAKKGYFLMWGDFGQFELKINLNSMFLLTQQELSTIKEIGDAYKGMAYLVSKRQGKQYDPEHAAKERDKYKVASLARAYECSLDTLIRTTNDDIFSRSLDDLFKNNPNYKSIHENIKKSLKVSSSIKVTSYFGTDVYINSQFLKEYELISKIFNTPIQTTASNIYTHTVNAIMDKFRSFGFGKDDVHIYLNRHDEVVFELSYKCLPYLWIIKEMSTVQVDDWTPIFFEPHFGFNYKQSDERLEAYYERCWKEALSKKLFVDEVREGKHYDYYPINKVRTISISVKQDFGSYFISLMDIDNNACISKRYELTQVESLDELIVYLVQEYCNRYGKDFDSLLVCCDKIPMEAQKIDELDIFVKYTEYEAVDVNKANIITDYALSIYRKKNNIESSKEFPENYLSFISELKPLAW